MNDTKSTRNTPILVNEFKNVIAEVPKNLNFVNHEDIGLPSYYCCSMPAKTENGFVIFHYYKMEKGDLGSKISFKSVKIYKKPILLLYGDSYKTIVELEKEKENNSPLNEIFINPDALEDDGIIYSAPVTISKISEA